MCPELQLRAAGRQAGSGFRRGSCIHPACNTSYLQSFLATATTATTQQDVHPFADPLQLLLLLHYHRIPTPLCGPRPPWPWGRSHVLSQLYARPPSTARSPAVRSSIAFTYLLVRVAATAACHGCCGHDKPQRLLQPCLLPPFPTRTSLPSPSHGHGRSSCCHFAPQPPPPLAAPATNAPSQPSPAPATATVHFRPALASPQGQAKVKAGLWACLPHS